MTISFTGHANISQKNKVKDAVKEQMCRIIATSEDVTCYLGGYGDFDEICACCCRELKGKYPFINLVYVTPYLDLYTQAKMQEIKKQGLYDATLYPPIEKAPIKFAILKRNEWMMTNADIVIAYVKRNSGGAYKSLQFAKRKIRKIINVCDFL